jgi:hypothetical protein
MPRSDPDPFPFLVIDDFQSIRLPRQQIRPAGQTLRRLRPAHELAPPLGALLGGGEVLLRRLPPRRQSQ